VLLSLVIIHLVIVCYYYFLNNCNCYCLVFSQSLVFGPLWSLVRHVRVMACVPCGHAFARPDPTCLNVNGRYCHNCQCSVLSVLCSILYCCGDLSNVRLHLQLDLDQDPGTGSLAWTVWLTGVTWRWYCNFESTRQLVINRDCCDRSCHVNSLKSLKCSAALHCLSIMIRSCAVTTVGLTGWAKKKLFCQFLC
jgi:hypothetical protein